MKNQNFRMQTLPRAWQGEDDPNAEAIATAVAAAVEAANTASKTAHDQEIAGLKKNNTDLLGKITTATDKLKKTEGVDIEGLLAFQSEIEDNEILRLAKEGKHSEAIDKATEKQRVTYAAELDGLKKKLGESETSGLKNVAVIDKLLIDGGAKAAFITAKGYPEAADDIALKARQTWKVEEGELVARDSKGELMAGEKGPLTMDEWVEGLKKTSPHFYPASAGGKLKGGDGGDVDLASIDGQIVAAANAGEFDLMRELKLQKKKGVKK